MRLLTYSITVFLFLLSIVYHGYSQQSLFTIEGRINYANPKPISVYVDTSLYRLQMYEIRILPDTNGYFKSSVKLQKPSFLSIFYGQKKWTSGYAVSGNTLILKFNSDENVEAEGKLACYFDFKKKEFEYEQINYNFLKKTTCQYHKNH